VKFGGKPDAAFSDTTELLFHAALYAACVEPRKLFNFLLGIPSKAYFYYEFGKET
jgi:hypothetical protein